MRWVALALVLAAGASGCGGSEPPRRARVWTLFDIVPLAADDDGGAVAVGALGFPGGISPSYFVTPVEDASGAETGDYALTVSQGFVDGQPMAYATTEVWENFDEVWVQPLYRALTGEGAAETIDDRNLAEPWVFGVGPDSRFYSPFWDVFGFRLPDAVDVTTVLDARAVLDAAGKTGGLKRLARRITSAVPANVLPAAAYGEYNYIDDTAAWDGTGGRRYLDFGTGRFDVDANGVVIEFPIFVFARRDGDGQLAALPGWPTVGGTRALFSGAPTIVTGIDAGDGDGGVLLPPLAPVREGSVELRFGGLWRMYVVELPRAALLTDDKRVLLNPEGCRESAPLCIVLDSQSAIESLGPELIHRTGLMASCPVLSLGNASFPRTPLIPPARPTSP